AVICDRHRGLSGRYTLAQSSCGRSHLLADARKNRLWPGGIQAPGETARPSFAFRQAEPGRGFPGAEVNIEFPTKEWDNIQQLAHDEKPGAWRKRNFRAGETRSRPQRRTHLRRASGDVGQSKK